MSNEISTYLEGSGDYDTGVALYERFGQSTSLKRILRMGGDTPGNIETLRYELSKITSVSVQPISPAPVKKVIQPPPLVQKVEVTARRENTPQADACRQEIISRLKVRDHLHASLSVDPSKDSRCKSALQILDLSDQIQQGYDRLEHFNLHGILPPALIKEPKLKPGDLSPIQLFQRQKTLRTYVSRYERLVKTAKTLKTIAKNQELLDRYCLELNDVNEKLNGII